jgi:hypothetical protein
MVSLRVLLALAALAERARGARDEARLGSALLGASSPSSLQVELAGGQWSCTPSCALSALDVNGQVVGSATVSGSADGVPGVYQVTAPNALWVRVVIGSEGAEALGLVTTGGVASVSALTTAAASYTLAYALSRAGNATALASLGAGYAASASAMYGNLVTASGTISSVLTSSPNADQTTGQRALNSLGNLVLASLSNATTLSTLLTLTTVGGERPASLGAGLANLARNPSLNVAAIFALIPSAAAPLYAPSFVTAPQSWMLVCKVHKSGDDSPAGLIGGLGKVIFSPSTGVAWITNNVVQGSPFSTTNIVALGPNGAPMSYSPIGGTLGTGFGIAFGSFGDEQVVWAGNFGWGPVKNCTFYPNEAPCKGSVSAVTLDGAAVQGSPFHDGPLSVQGMDVDAENNLWIASYGSDEVWLWLAGSPGNARSLLLYNGSQPFDVHTYGTTAWVSSGGGITGSDAASSLSQLSLDQSTGQLVLLQQVWFGVAIKGFSIDSSGNMWVASQGDSLVYKVSQQGTILGKYNGGGVNGPWSATVDGEDNVWVANFGPLELADAYSPRITKLSNAGSALSPSEGWIVENAGDQVLLADGTPLYGEGAPPSYNALMRMTYIGIDLAGYVPQLARL